MPVCRWTSFWRCKAPNGHQANAYDDACESHGCLDCPLAGWKKKESLICVPENCAFIQEEEREGGTFYMLGYPVPYFGAYGEQAGQ